MHLIIDGSNLAFRSYHVMNHLRSSKGYPTGMVYGFFSILNSYSKIVSRNVIVSWEGGKTWRKEKYPEYKATRKEREPEIAVGFDDIRNLCDYSGVVQCRRVGYESDDMIASLCRLLDKDIRIISNDKDMLQLINSKKNIKVLRPSAKEGLVEYDEARTEKEFDIEFNHLPAYLAIKGDKSDNIPGLKGWGEVKTTKFLRSCIDEDPIKKLQSMYPEESANLGLWFELVSLSNTPDITETDIIRFPDNNYQLLMKLHEFEITQYTSNEIIDNLSNLQFYERLNNAISRQRS